MSFEEIRFAIAQLSSQDLAGLMSWLGEYRGTVWDEQIHDDLERGRLDTVLAEIDQEYEAGLAHPL